MLRNIKRQWQYHLMLLPGVVVVFIFSYIPSYFTKGLVLGSVKG